MKTRELSKNIYAIGVQDWDRRLFDSLIPLPDGTSYNSYLVKGSEKTALIDTVDPVFTKEWLENISNLELPRIDYIIANHAEQDHSGSLPAAIDAFPEAKIVTNAKCRDILIDLLHLSADNFLVIEDKQVLSLGDKTLEFYLTPWVHWPETMVTYLKEDKILFSCDFLGSHYATSDIFAKDTDKIIEDAKRYYAEIMMPFRTHIKKHLELVKNLAPVIIAPSHGPVYDKPKIIFDAYADWISDQTKDEILILYVSMHESTRFMARALGKELIDRGVQVKEIDLAVMDIGKVAMELVDARTVVVGSPTVLSGAHPLAAYAVYLFNALRPKTKYVSIIGSYSWGGKMVEQLAGMITNVKPEIIPPVVCKGLPRAEDYAAIANLAEQIAQKHHA